MGIYRNKYKVVNKSTGKVSIKKSPYFSISWTDKEKDPVTKKRIQHRESTGCKVYDEAQEILVEKLRAVKKTRHPFLKDDQKITFAKFSERFIDEYQGTRGDLSESSRTNYIGLMKKLREHFGELNLGDINETDVDGYVAKRKQDTVSGLGNKKLSHFTINRELAVLRLMLNWAEEKNIIGTNPVKKRVARKKVFKEVPRKLFFTQDDLIAILSTAREPWKSFLLVGMYTGMRLSEILGLRWDEVDIKNRTITLPVERTKGKESREVALGKMMVDLFNSMKLQRGDNELVFPSPVIPENREPQPYSKYFSNTWKRLLKRAGIKRPLHFHDLRRTFITKAIGAGAGVKDVQEMVGHKDATTTLRNYAQATKEGKRRVAALVDFREPSGELVELEKKASSLG